MRFANIVRGTRARRTVSIEMPDGGALVCDVRPLNGLEEAEVLAKARAFAEGRGVKEPKDGEPIYELGKQVHTLLAACVDTESPAEAPAPFFASADEILEGLDRDHRSYLYEHQESWEDQCAPRPSVLDEKGLLQICTDVLAADEGDDGPFVRLRPVLRWSCMRTLAALHVISPLHKSPSGSPSGGSSASGTTANPTPDA